jgi:signal transduction histidine kinase
MSALSSSSLGVPNALARIFPGDSELAGRMRTFDWAATELGEPRRWPVNLKVALQICLASRFPMHVWWGPSLTLFYNDAYISFLGSQKHPAVLGRSGREAWSEIWPTIGPMIESVIATGVASWSEDILMFFERQVPKEEVYVTFSFSPIYGDDDKVEGLFCACTETTAKLIDNRRSEIIRQLAARGSGEQTPYAACRKAAEILGEEPNDVPFAAIYLADGTGTQATLCAATRVVEEHALPRIVTRDDIGPPWSLGSVLRNERAEEIDVTVMSRAIRAGPWPEPIEQAVVLPIPGTSHVAGLLVIGASPRRPFDDGYRSFFQLIAAHIGTAIAQAEAHEAERLRATNLAEIDRAESNRVKDEFIAMLGHELRNPLSPILTAVQLLRMQGEQSRELSVIERQANHLVRLVDDLLDVSRITRGKIELRKQRFELGSIVLRAVEMASPLLEQRWQRLEVNACSEGLVVDGDGERLAQVVSNLLTNASKYSEPHTTIRVEANRKGPAIELRVKDEGIGIPDDMLDRVFDMFVQQPQASDRSKGGLGLGLAIVRSLVTLHGGNVWATSAGVGKGSEFIVELPAADVGERSAPSTWPVAERPSAPPPPGGGRRILVVDDNDDAVDTLAMILSQIGYQVATARDGPSAIETARRFHPQICLLDIGLPVMDGYELAARLRTLDSCSRDMRLIAVTGYGTDADRRRSREAGFSAHVVKPVNFEELMRLVAN